MQSSSLEKKQYAEDTSLPRPQSVVTHRPRRTFLQGFTRFLPPPDFLSIPSVGLDVSSHSVRFLELSSRGGKVTLGYFAEYHLAQTIALENIFKENTLREVLALIKKDHPARFISVALPEDRAYIFRTSLPLAAQENLEYALELQLEENVPLPANEIVFDFSVLPTQSADKIDVVVSAFPKKIINDTIAFFAENGFVVTALLTGASASTKALIADGDYATTMIVNVGRQVSGLAIVEYGIPQFVTTIAFGSTMVSEAMSKHLGISVDEAQAMKGRNDFLQSKEMKHLFDAMVGPLSVLKDEISRRVNYWQSRRQNNQSAQKINRIILCGHDADIPGLDEYLSTALSTHVELGNIWQNIFSLGEYIPPLPHHDSLRFATAAGVAIEALRATF